MSDGRDNTLLSTKEAAQRAGVNVRRVREWCYQGRIPFTMEKHQIRLRREDFDNFLLGREIIGETWERASQDLRTLAPVTRAETSRLQGEVAGLRREVAGLKQERDRLHRALTAAHEGLSNAMQLLKQLLNAGTDREVRLFRLLEHTYAPTQTHTPAKVTLTDRVLAELTERGEARTPKQVQLALGVSRSVERVLRYLVERGDVYRPKKGYYQVMPTLEKTKQERIVAYLRTEGRPTLAVKIAEQLGLEDIPYSDLGKLEKKGFVQKVRPGLYRAVQGVAETHEDTSSPADVRI